ncbi:MAG: fibrinogen-like YCDxxxxGGGW domain-containing protein [Pseudomonadota bacterium]
MTRRALWLAAAAPLAAGCMPDVNPLPNAPVVAIDPFYPTTADDLQANIAIPSEDPDFDPIIYRYQWYQDGQARAGLQQALVSWVETSRGEQWKVVVTPWDGEGAGAQGEMTITVVNAPPVVEVALLPDAPLASDDVAPVVTTWDLDGDDVTVAFSWALEGSDRTWNEETLPAEQTARGDRWVLTAVPDDTFDEGAPATAAVDIENRAPVVISVELGPTGASRDDTLTATVIAEDGDEDEITLDYAWSVDGVVLQQGEENTLAPSLFSRGDRVVVTVTPNDSFVDGAPVRSNLLEIADAVPTITAVSLTPATAYEASTLACTPSGWADSDSDPAGYRYAWTVNGGVISATGATLEGGDFDRGDVLTCRAAPWDGLLEGEALESDAVTIQDTAPVVRALSLSDTSPATDDTLAVSVSAEDDDGDGVSLAYAWYVSGALVGSGTTLSGANFAKGDTVYVVVTPSDGTLTGSAATSATATVVNTAPVLTSLALSPTALYTDDILTTAVTATDADGDTVTFDYTWTSDGAALSASGSSLDGATDFSKHEVLQVTVTPDGGDDQGLPVTSAAVEVLDSAPEAPVVGIDPPDPAASDALVCEVQVAAPDADRDTLTYAFAWTVDGAPFSGTATTTTLTGDTVVADHTVSGQVWTCTVTPDDGEESGPSASDSVTICPPGSERDCPALSCAETLASVPSASDGTYWLDPVGGSPYQASCEMSTDDGGWTLLAVVSDDGQDTWTWTNRHYWDTDATTVGDLSHLTQDYKSRALHQLPFTDLLFVHQPSGDWAAYHDVGDGADDLGTFIAWWGGTECWAEGDGWDMSDGTIGAFYDLCSTQLYFNARDHDGGATCGCADCDDDAYGPVWSAINTSSCPFDDPGPSGGLGPQGGDVRVESTALGFGAALGLNTGTAASGANLMLVYAR